MRLIELDFIRGSDNGLSSDNTSGGFKSLGTFYLVT